MVSGFNVTKEKHNEGARHSLGNGNHNVSELDMEPTRKKFAMDSLKPIPVAIVSPLKKRKKEDRNSLGTENHRDSELDNEPVKKKSTMHCLQMKPDATVSPIKEDPKTKEKPSCEHHYESNLPYVYYGPSTSTGIVPQSARCSDAPLNLIGKENMNSPSGSTQTFSHEKCSEEENMVYMPASELKKMKTTMEFLRAYVMADLLRRKDESSDSLLHLAATEGRPDVLEALLEFKFDPNVQGMCGNTPLHLAVMSGDLECVQTLLARGAAVNIVNDEGLKATDLARAIGQTGMMDLFMHFRSHN